MDIQVLQKRLLSSSQFENMEYCLRFSHALTAAIRTVQFNSTVCEAEKLDSIKWLNEIQHRVISYLLEIHLGKAELTEQELVTMAYHIGANNVNVKNHIMWALKSALNEEWQ